MYVDIKQAYHFTQLDRTNTTNIPYINYITETKLFKFKCKDKRVYHVTLEVYRSKVAFIKFFPLKQITNPNKFKIRTGKQPDFNRILATCVKLAEKEIRKRPDLIYAFFGQWDDKDVISKRVVSQRFNLYTYLATTYFVKESYHHVNYPDINLYFLLDKEHFNFNNSKEVKEFLYNKIMPDLPREAISSLVIPEHDQL